DGRDGERGVERHLRFDTGDDRETDRLGDERERDRDAGEQILRDVPEPLAAVARQIEFRPQKAAQVGGGGDQATLRVGADSARGPIAVRRKGRNVGSVWTSEAEAGPHAQLRRMLSSFFPRASSSTSLSSQRICCISGSSISS